jgi:hypothetical protein
MSLLAKSFRKRLGLKHEKLKDKVVQWHTLDKKVWIWGAGSAGGEIFNVYGQEPQHFNGYIDSDPGKANMRFPMAADLPICTPQDAYQKGVDVVLITSYSVKEIRQQIKSLDWGVEVVDIYS